MNDTSENIKEFIRKNSKVLIMFLLVFFVVLVAIFFLFRNPYSKQEKQMIKLAKTYFATNQSSNYATLTELNLNYDNCQNYSGVYYNNGTYKAYLFCNDYSSIEDLNQNNKTITLNGANPVVLKTSDVYQDPGYISNNKVDLINTYQQKEGIYFINYIVRSSNGERLEQATRIVIVKDDVASKNAIVLKGEKKISLFKGEKYVEPGYTAYDDLGNDVTSLVKVNSNVNVSIPGDYKVTYSATISNYKTMTVERTVKVLDLNVILELEEDEPVLNTNKINLIITGKDYKHTVLPDNKQSTSRSIEYPVTTNGTYNFKIYTNTRELTKSIVVDNVYTEITASCTLSQSNNKQVFANVTASGGYGTLNFSYFDKTDYSTYTPDKTYNFKNKVNKTTIKVKDSIDNIKEISCSNPNIKVDKLEVHFIKISSGRYDAILFRLGDNTLFVDGGLPEHYSQIDTYLKAIGVDHIDVIVGSHGHNNHVGPQAKIIRNYNVKRAYYNQDIYNCFSCDEGAYDNIIKALKEKNVTPVVSTIGSTFYFTDEVKFETVGPLEKKSYPNSYSTNYIISFQGVKMMITGDGIQQSNVLSRYTAEQLDVDIFKWPHHGQHSLTTQFLNTIKPEYVVVTNHQDTVGSNEKSTLKKFGTQFYQHYKHGNIVIIIDDGKISFKTNVDPKTYKLD